MNITRFLQSLLSPHPCVVSYESSRRAYSVQPVRDWRAQKKEERAAGYTTSYGNILVPWFKCDLCTIGIGPNHEQQHLYLYPVYEEKVKHQGGGLQKRESEIYRICGECASWKSRQLPEWLCCIGPWCWETNDLLEYYKESNPVSQKHAAVIHMEVCECLLIFVYAIAFNVRLSDCWRIMLSVVEEEQPEKIRMPLIQTKGQGSRMKSIFASITDPGFGFAH